MGAYRALCARGAKTPPIPALFRRLVRPSEATASSWVPKTDVHVRLFCGCAMSFVMFPLSAEGLCCVICRAVAALFACELAQGGPLTVP